MIDFVSDFCYQCDGQKVVFIHNEAFGTRMETVYQIHDLEPGERLEIACQKCGLLYSEASLSVQHVVRRNEP